MGNTVKTPRASEETNVPSQTGKHSFNIFQEKKMLHSSMCLPVKAGKCMTAVGERGHPLDSAYF